MVAATPWLCHTLQARAAELSGTARRQFMATVTNALGPGGQRWVEVTLGWNRVTVRKGQRELAGQLPAVDHFDRRGRKPAHHHLPTLHTDICLIVKPNLEQDPTFRTTQLYRRVTASMVRESLLEVDPYTDTLLPSVRTICGRLNALGFRPRKVLKSKPKKKIPQTDAIFDLLHQINAQADQDPRVLRLSIDTKAAIKVGPFSRGGRNRCGEQANDHDFAPVCVLQLFGVFVPQHDASYFFFNPTKATADWFVDSLERLWPRLKQDYPAVDKLVINLDNGPENHSRRTQFVMRMVQFVHAAHVPISLAYYPPYHSKYNPIERVWGALENHWRGELLDSQDKVLGLAESMKWNGQHPHIEHTTTVYRTGQKLSKADMKPYESLLHRHEGLGCWFVDIYP